MSDTTQHGFATRAIHLGYDPLGEQGALSPPLYLTATYTQDSIEAFDQIRLGERQGYVYGRTRNPTQALLEERLASLEGAEAGVVTASGMAAISATLFSLLRAGDEIVVDQIVYGTAFTLFSQGLERFGVRAVFADFTRPETVAAAIGEKTRAVYFETPANPNLRLVDIAAVSAIARGRGLLTIVDNTFATPVLQRPLEHGADIVLHSATKYLGGHGDLLAGAVLGRKEHIDAIRLQGLRYFTGATLSPFTAFLVLRGIKTLELRVQRHSESARKVAELLRGHAAVADVFYPGLPDTAGADIARRQQSAGGGLVAFELKGGLAAGRRLLNSLKLARIAVSLGDPETLIQHPASMTHASYTAEDRERYGLSESLLRLSVGLETPEDILADLRQGLDRA
ncbi:methionine gamma-lyase [Achromobacter denitrificans]|uniref:trans-sulfuration enzyme family protein n=1 Tax=Achromobacter denitrificans TaxID=32002 RepID=UPI000B4D82DF|nr:aminotransferase class I/II-fold pyridoxal phosphate-dependent enzyme [Achromobacter denitrificans]ASC66817.1 methionine gamma-lyase [Achromobacter denitrificans]